MWWSYRLRHSKSDPCPVTLYMPCHVILSHQNWNSNNRGAFLETLTLSDTRGEFECNRVLDLFIEQDLKFESFGNLGLNYSLLCTLWFLTWELSDRFTNRKCHKIAHCSIFHILQFWYPILFCSYFSSPIAHKKLSILQCL